MSKKNSSADDLASEDDDGSRNSPLDHQIQVPRIEINEPSDRGSGD